MWRPGMWEIVAILAVVLILFGPKQLPKLGKMFGKTMKNVKDGMEGKFEEDESTEKKAELSASSESKAATSEKSEEKSEA